MDERMLILRSQEPEARRRPGGARLPKGRACHPKVNRRNPKQSMDKADKRAEPWPTIDHGSARIVA